MYDYIIIVHVTKLIYLSDFVVFTDKKRPVKESNQGNTERRELVEQESNGINIYYRGGF